MADKNLHDIKIDELDSPKKTPLKNIVTLIALLFIILVISIVITKLILNTDEGSSIENNDSNVSLTTNIDTEETNKSDETSTDESENALTAVPTIASNITERNLTSVIKRPLTSYEPKKDEEVIKTYTTPKKTTTESVPTPAPKPKVIVETEPKKEYIDRVVIKKEPVKTPVTTPTQEATFLGGNQMAVSNSYYIKVGTYRDTETVVEKIKKNNFNYSLVKVENDTTLTRVLVGPFFSRNEAGTQLATVQGNILEGAYITKAK